MTPGRILVVSYHFGDTTAIGAARINALVNHLLKDGVEVDVIYCRASLDQTNPPAGLGLHSIADPGPRLIPRLLKVRNAFRDFFHRAQRDAHNRQGPGAGLRADGKNETPRGRNAGPFGWLKHQILCLIYLFDGRKRWALRAVRTGLGLANHRRYDCILSSGPPAIAHLVSTVIGARCNIPCALDLRDPWNGNSVLYTRARLPTVIDRWSQRVCLTRAALITCASPGIERVMTERFPELAGKINVVLNGFDDADRLDPPPTTGRMDMLYAGMLYPWRDPFPLLSSIKRLITAGKIDRMKLSFKFIGECEYCGEVSLREWLHHHGLEDIVQLHPRMPRNELETHTAVANVLVSFSRDQPNQIPAKTYHLLASAREMLILAEETSDTARVLAAAGIHGCVDDRDTARLDATVLEMYLRLVGELEIARPDRDVESFHRDRQNLKWVELLAANVTPAS